MATKDWHEVRTTYKADISKKWVNDMQQMIFIFIRLGGRYSVEMFENGAFYPNETKIFTNKAMALKFAKAYMRTH